MKPILPLLLCPLLCSAQSYGEYADELPQTSVIGTNDTLLISTGGMQKVQRNLKAYDLLEAMKGFNNWPQTGGFLPLTNGMTQAQRLFVGPQGLEFWSNESDGTQRKMGLMDFSGEFAFDSLIGEHHGTYYGDGTGLTNVQSAVEAGHALTADFAQYVEYVTNYVRFATNAQTAATADSVAPGGMATNAPVAGWILQATSGTSAKWVHPNTIMLNAVLDTSFNPILDTTGNPILDN